MKKRIAIIGSGFSGLSASAYTAKEGHEVHVFEKHNQPGGRARQLKTEEGYVFDMGPSWYWMPDVIQDFFEDFGYTTSSFFELISLNPQFEMIFSDEKIDVPENFEALKETFEKIEKGAGFQLEKFMKSAKFKYEVGMKDFVHKPCANWSEFISLKIAKSALRLDLLSNFRAYVARYFKDKKLRALMEFPVIFLGASPEKIPALYSLMNYGGYVLGTYYPKGGFYQLVLAMKKVAEEQGANFHFNSNVEKINVKNQKVSSLLINGKIHEFDEVIASSDYHHTETLLNEEYRNYTADYWRERTFAPSCLIFYLGFNETIPHLKHHTLFFEHDLDLHIDSIYEDKRWPEKPLFYACCSSKTDHSVAPNGKENLFLLMPIATGINDSEFVRQKYLTEMLLRLEKHTGTQDLQSKIDFKKVIVSEILCPIIMLMVVMLMG